MAISLNSVNSTLSNHASRITALEGKVGSGGGIIESKLANPGYVKFANGLIINWGISSNQSGTFAKAFSTPLGIVVSPYRSGFACYAEHWHVTSLTTTGFRIQSDSTASRSRFVAIGYLITNRLLNYIHEKLNSFKNLKGVMNGKTWRSFYNLMADRNVGDKRDCKVSKFAVNNGGVLEWL